MTLSYLSAEHHQRRRNTLQNSLLKEGLETFLVFNPTNIFYLTGFAFIPTERPLCAILHKGQLSFFVPQLEVEHVKHQVGRLENVFSYFDYPSDEIHPMVRLANILEKEVKINPRQFASEAAGSSPYWGYLGPKLEEIMKNSVKVLPNIVTDMRIIKEEEEIHLLRASSYFAARAHRQLQELTKVGRNEIEVSIEASRIQGNAVIIGERLPSSRLDDVPCNGRISRTGRGTLCLSTRNESGSGFQERRCLGHWGHGQCLWLLFRTGTNNVHSEPDIQAEGVFQSDA